MSRTGVGGVPGVGGGSILSVTPSAIGFGNETVGSTSASRSVTISNQGQLGLSVSQVSIVPPEFKLSGPTPPITIPPGSSVTYNVAFAPDAAQAFSGSVLVTSNASNGIGKASLSGTGVLQTTVLNVLPATISFGSELVNTTSSPQNVLLTNGGVTAIAISGVQTSTPFAVAGFSGSATLNPAQSLTLSVTFTPTGQTSYAGFLTITGSAPSSPDTAALSGAGGAVCGQPNDGQAHPPTNYTSFTPPPKGGAYVDPDFGCTVKRVSDAVNDFGANTGVHHGYSLLSPFNANDTLLSLCVENGPGWYIADMNGSIVVPPANMVGDKNVQWDASNPYVYWNTSGTRLLQATINYSTSCASAHNCTVTAQVWHDFAASGYTAIENTETGGSPISYDGDHVALAGMKAGSSVFDYYFVWQLSTNAVDYQPSGSGKSVWHPSGVTSMHAFQITGKNSIKVGLTSTNYNNDVIWDGTNAYQFQVNSAHTDFGLDLAGDDVALIDRNADTADPCPRGGGSDVQKNWTTAMSFSCWFDKNWRDGHTNYQGGPKQPWAVWSAFHDPKYDNIYNIPPESDWQAVWPQWAGEVVVARIDANNNPASVYRLAHHRSHPAYLNQFWRQPHASISRSGKYVMFDSDMGSTNSAGGNGYTDAYIIQIQ